MSLSLVLWCAWWLGGALVSAQPPLFSSYLSLTTLGAVTLPGGIWYSGGSYTIEGWVRHGTYVRDDAVLFEATTSYLSETGSIGLYVRRSGANSPTPIAGTVSMAGATNALDPPGWIHVAVVYDSVGVEIRTYVNGTLAVTNGFQSISTTSKGAVFVGGNGNACCMSYGYVGDIDELRIWTVARTEVQLNAAMLTPLFGNEAGLFAYYRFDVCGASTALDSTSGGRTGNVTANAAIVCSPTPAPTSAPTLNPTASPTAAPTAAPTARPTANPTANPTAGPTAQPTASPTLTQAPSAAPTAAPTAAPSAVPTRTPTAAPTGTPTAAPTAAPTARPTAQPTPAPTALTCLMGQFTNSTPACQTCAAGTYTNSTSATVCASCALGYVAASSGATGCTACTAGRTANATGLSVCLNCTAGFFAASSAATTCDVCLSGGNATSCPLTLSPTAAPTAVPSTSPTPAPSSLPTASPTAVPTTATPTATPTAVPTASPTTASPTASPTATPTAAPTTASPTATPTLEPTAVPTATPTLAPTLAPMEETVLLVDNTTTIVMIANGGTTATATALDFTPCGDRTGWVTRYLFDLVGAFAQPIKVRVQSTVRQRRIHKQRVLSVCPDSETGWIPAHTYSCPDGAPAPTASSTVLVESQVCHNTPFGVQDPEVDGDCHNLPRWCEMCVDGTRGCACEYDSNDVYGSSERAAYSSTGIVLVVISLLLEALHEELHTWHTGRGAADVEAEGLLIKTVDSTVDRWYFPIVTSLVFLLGWFLVAYPVATDLQNSWSTTLFNTTEFYWFWLTLFAVAAALHVTRSMVFLWVQRNTKTEEWWWVWVVSVLDALAWVGVLLFPYTAVEETYGSASNVPTEWQTLYYLALAWALVQMADAGTVTAPARRAAPRLAVFALVARVGMAVALGVTWTMVAMRLPCE